MRSLKLVMMLDMLIVNNESCAFELFIVYDDDIMSEWLGRQVVIIESCERNFFLNHISLVLCRILNLDKIYVNMLQSLMRIFACICICSD